MKPGILSRNADAVGVRLEGSIACAAAWFGGSECLNCSQMETRNSVKSQFQLGSDLL